MSRQRKVVYMMVVYAILMGSIELATRVFFHYRHAALLVDKTSNAQSIFLPHPFMTYVGNPARKDHTPEGFRGHKAYSLEHESLRVACLGGSSTYDTRVREEDSYPRQLERILNERGPEVEVMNCGLAGYSTPNVLAMLSLKVIHYKPELAVFDLGWNDIWNRIYWPDFQPDYSHALKSWERLDYPWWRRSLFLDKFAVLLGSPSPRDPHIHAICWKPRKGSGAENWATSDSKPFVANLRSLAAICRAHGIEPVFVTQPVDFEHHDFEPGGEGVWPGAVAEYRSILLNVAMEENLPILDLAPIMSNHTQYFADVLHMNKEGNQVRAAMIADFLVERFPEHFQAAARH